jgi:uncharacterized peroxidase-related enzyme
MPRIAPVAVETATGKAKTLLEGVKAKLGFVPNLMGSMGHAPAVLEAYLNFSGALSHGVLSAKVREQISLAVAEANTCDYCASAHTTIGKMVGLSDADTEASRRASSGDVKTDTILKLAQRLVLGKGRLTDVEISKAKAAGVSDEELQEVIANVSLNIFTNYFNHVIDPVIDFPTVIKTKGVA